MTVSVLVPFASTNPDRLALLPVVLAQYEAFSWQVIVAGTEGPWCKAEAVARCLTQATGDLLVVADADCLCNGTADAVEAVELGAAWSMPHLNVHRLDPDATDHVLAGRQPNVAMKHTERPYRGKEGGGIVVLPRDTYESVPLDPRFVLWGQEDESLGLALDCLVGDCVRFDHDLFHLWHEPAPRDSRRIGNHEGRLLARRYWHARSQPDDMRALIEEAKTWTPPTS